MFRLTLRGLWAHKLRFALTGLAVVLGVAFMAGTMVLTDTMARSFDAAFTTANDGVDVVVQRPSEFDTDVGDARERVPADLVEQVREVDGVAAASGSIQGFAQIVDGDGQVASLDGLQATLGTNWLGDELGPLEIAAGREPSGADDVVIDQATADDQGWDVGSEITVLGKTGPRVMSLVGVATYGSIDGLPGLTMVATDDATAQEMFGENGAYDSIVVRAGPDVDNGELATRISDSFGSTDASTGDLEVLTGAEDTAERQADLHDDLAFFNTFLLAFAYVALFVGMFIIYNTFTIVLAQRTRDLALLRAIGAGRRQVLGSVLGEAAGIGVIASAVGLGLGVAMSFGLRALLAAVGLDIPTGGVVVSGATVTTSFVIGFVVTMLSAIGPALRAGRVAPMAALRDAAIERPATSVGRIVTGVATIGLGTTAFVAGILGEGVGAVQLLGIGALITVIGLVVLGPVVARPIVHVLGAPAAKVSGPMGRLARENAQRNPKRTAATAAALMIGVALVGFISILASSTKASVGEHVEHSFRADFVLDSGAWGEGGFSPLLASDIAALDGVDAVSPVRSTPFGVDGGDSTLWAVDTAVFDELTDLGVVDGALADVGPGAVAVQQTRADELGLHVGDDVTVDFARTGPVDLTVGAIVTEDILGVGDTTWLVDTSTFEANVSDQYDQQVMIGLGDDVDVEAARSAIEDVAADWPGAEVQDQTAFKAGITDEIDQLLNLIYGLLALAVVIALIGIANTLALSVHERTRELGLLRAIGTSRSQVRAAVRWESVLISLLGATLGIALAIGGAWGIVQALGDEGVESMVLPTTTLAVIVGMAVVAGVLAATGPARRAARLDVLRAIATE